MQKVKAQLITVQNPDHQARSGRPKTVDSKFVLLAIETNLVSSNWRASGERGISPSSRVHYFLNLGKNIYCRMVDSPWVISLSNQLNLAQSTGVVEYTDCISAEG